MKKINYILSLVNFHGDTFLTIYKHINLLIKKKKKNTHYKQKDITIWFPSLTQELC